MQGNPLDTDTMIGAQASNDQLEKILSYIDIGTEEGAQVLTGGERADLGGDLSGGYYVAPTIFEGHNKMRIFQEEIFGPVVVGHQLRRLRRRDQDRQRHPLRPRRRRLDARHQHRVPGGPRHPGRPGVDELLPRLPGARGVRRLQESGIGRENHKMMLDHYQQTKNLLVSLLPAEARLLLIELQPLRRTRSATRRRRVTLGRRRTCSAASPSEHGPLMFHQSGGCCDGSSPDVLPGRRVPGPGDADVLLGRGRRREPPTSRSRFWMIAAQFEYWQHTHLTIDVVPGRGGGLLPGGARRASAS